MDTPPLNSRPAGRDHEIAGMVPLFVGAARRLFVTYHAADSALRRHVGVVLCNPFGQEALRAHRLYRVLAERLARAGVDVARFDYFGTGDSFGNDHDGELVGWCDDIVTVHTELVRRSGARELVWVGTRLGATMVAQTAGRAPGELRRIVLVDPIVDGSEYARALRVGHVDRLEQVFQRPRDEWRRNLQNDPTAYLDEASGYGVAAGFHAQLRQLGTASLGLPPALKSTVIYNPRDPAVDAWRSASGKASKVEWIPLDHGYDWSAHDAIGGILLPAGVLRQLAQTVLG